MLQSWWEIRKVTRAAQKCERFYEAALSELKRGKHTRDDIENLRAEAGQETYDAWEKRDRILTKHLLRDARLLDIPIPSRDVDAMWESHPYAPHDKYLSRQGVSVVRKAIRDEQQARGIYPKILFTAVTSCIAAMGAILTVIKMVYDWFAGGP